MIFALMLLAVGCEKKPTGKETPLHKAARTGNIEQVQKFLVQGARVNAQSNILYETPLHYAAAHGHQDIVELLAAKAASTGCEGN